MEKVAMITLHCCKFFCEPSFFGNFIYPNFIVPVKSFEKCTSEECSQKLMRNNSVAASEQDDNASVVAKHCNFELPSDSTSLSSDLSDQKAASTTLDPSTRDDSSTRNDLQ